MPNERDKAARARESAAPEAPRGRDPKEKGAREGSKRSAAAETTERGASRRNEAEESAPPEASKRFRLKLIPLRFNLKYALFGLLGVVLLAETSYLAWHFGSNMFGSGSVAAAKPGETTTSDSQTTSDNAKTSEQPQVSDQQSSPEPPGTPNQQHTPLEQDRPVLQDVPEKADTPDKADSAENPGASDKQDPAASAEKEGEIESQEETVPAEGILAIDPFTVNLADTDEPHYMRLSLKLGMDSQKAVENVGKSEIMVAKIRDAILGVISVTTSRVVLSVEGKAKLRKEIMRHVNAVIKGGKVVEVYFLELVVQ